MGSQKKDKQFASGFDVNVNRIKQNARRFSERVFQLKQIRIEMETRVLFPKSFQTASLYIMFFNVKKRRQKRPINDRLFNDGLHSICVSFLHMQMADYFL